MPKIYYETDKFILREFIYSDTEGIFEMEKLPEVHKYIGRKHVTSIDKIRDIITHVRNQYDKYGIGRWAVIDPKTEKFMGWTGLKNETLLTNGFDNYIDLGFRFHPDYWGQGLATETGKISVEYGFQKMGYKEICGAAHVENIGSNKALQKCGLKFVNEFEYDGSQHNWYSINKD